MHETKNTFTHEVEKKIQTAPCALYFHFATSHTKNTSIYAITNIPIRKLENPLNENICHWKVIKGVDKLISGKIYDDFNRSLGVQLNFREGKHVLLLLLLDFLLLASALVRVDI